MASTIRLSLLYSIVLFLYGCNTPAFLTPEELNTYILDPDHGLIQRSELNGYAVEVLYRPTDLWVQQELGNEPSDTTSINTLRKKYSIYYYFIVNLSKNNKEALHQAEGGQQQYSELVQTLSFRMNNYVSLTTTKSDTIPTADFILNRTYGYSDATSLLFVFNREKAKGEEWVQFNLNEFGLGIGNQRFRFKTQDLEGAPQIDFEL